MRAALSRRATAWTTCQSSLQCSLTRGRRGNASSSDQATPFHGFHQDLLDAPLHSVGSATHTAPPLPPQHEIPDNDKEERISKARIVFGSRLAGPAERKKTIDAESQMIAGVKVPPKPTEPDNCCMSGCVNCVWDLYRDELEDWAAASAAARAKLIDQRLAGRATGMMAKEKGTPNHAAVSMDDDGGGSETNWSDEEQLGAAVQDPGADLFKDIPVGIREFMKTEKRLKQMRESAKG